MSNDTNTPQDTEAANGDGVNELRAKLALVIGQQEKSSRLLVRRDLELTRANEKLRELDQLKTDFVSVTTHQLRTPLSGMKWMLSMFLKGDMGPLTTEQRTFLFKGLESNERMIRLINDMLVSDQIQSGKLKPLNSTTLLPDLPDNVVLDIKPVADRKGITIEFSHVDPKYLSVRIAPEHLRAILQNLMENAIKYSKVGDTVKLELRAQEHSVLFVVSDQGIGIPHDLQKKVFSRFFRAPNAIIRETDGSGLGLFIVKNIVERNEGTIRFESVEDQGTTFYVELPTVPKDAVQ